MIIIQRGSSVSESTVCGLGAYVISDADSHGIGTRGPFEAHRSLISDEWDRVMSNSIDLLTDGAPRNPNMVTITELCVERMEACTAGLSGDIYTVVFPNCNFGVWAFSGTQLLPVRDWIDFDILHLHYPY